MHVRSHFSWDALLLTRYYLVLIFEFDTGVVLFTSLWHIQIYELLSSKLILCTRRQA